VFQLLPGLFGGTVAVVLALVLLKATATHGWPAWLRAAVVLAAGMAIAAAVQLLLVPRLRDRVLRQGHVGEVRARVSAQFLDGSFSMWSRESLAAC
jgi:hypothetical protein